jgi:predicted extracellular nuclease
LVAADQALVVSYVKTGQFEQARELAINGATHAGPYAALYQGMLKELPALEATITNSTSLTSNTTGQASPSKK